jgi:hypothetical protein
MRITIAASAEMTNAAGRETKSMGTAAAMRNMLLSSHTNDPSNFSSHLTEGSLASSKLRNSARSNYQQGEGKMEK